MKPKIGLALGSGSARGWAHIGVIRALQEAGIRPDVLSGCSIGALVGAAYADGDLDDLQDWVTGLAWQDVVGLLDVGFNGGLIKGEKLIGFFEKHFVDKDFSALPLPFGCVATDLANGREIWLREGSVAAAVRASIAVPGRSVPPAMSRSVMRVQSMSVMDARAPARSAASGLMASRGAPSVAAMQSR